MGFRFPLDSGLHVADGTEAPAAARDVDDAAPLVTAEGRRWTATWAVSLDAARAASASGLVMLCHSLLLEASRRLSPTSSSSFCTVESYRSLVLPEGCLPSTTQQRCRRDASLTGAQLRSSMAMPLPNLNQKSPVKLDGLSAGAYGHRVPPLPLSPLPDASP